MDPLFYKNLFTISETNLHRAVQGGALIALASSIYYFLFGGILGMSGMAGSLIKFPTREATKIKAIALLGMVFASALINYLYEEKKILHHPFDSLELVLGSSVTHLVVSGLLVGVGTELSNGCTSGHGLCGLPRFSLRSFVSVLVFLSTAIATATLSLGQYIPEVSQLKLKALDHLEINPLHYLIGVLALTALLFFTEKQKSLLAKIALFVIGVVFGCGLMIAGMSQRSKIYGFLELNSNWDPSLLFVLMTGVILNVITFTVIRKTMQQPVYGDKIEDPHGKVTLRLILGSVLFGLGWGLGGLCPGPYLLSIPYSLKLAFYWGVPFFFGQKLTNMVAAEGHKHHPHHEVSEKPHETAKETPKETKKNV